MSKEKKPVETTPEESAQTPEAEAIEANLPEVQANPPETQTNPLEQELEQLKSDLAAEHDKLLRLAAEFDNYRTRSNREKDRIYTDAKAEVTEKFLPVYDNLARALAVETADEAYKKGVEMTMNGLLEILGKLNVEVYGEPGDLFDPTIHNAVMHVEDEQLKESTVVEVFQKGFRMSDKVVRFAMVKVAN